MDLFRALWSLWCPWLHRDALTLGRGASPGTAEAVLGWTSARLWGAQWLARLGGEEDVSTKGSSDGALKWPQVSLGTGSGKLPLLADFYRSRHAREDLQQVGARGLGDVCARGGSFPECCGSAGRQMSGCCTNLPAFLGGRSHIHYSRSS